MDGYLLLQGPVWSTTNQKLLEFVFCLVAKKAALTYPNICILFDALFNVGS